MQEFRMIYLLQKERELQK